MPGETSMGGPAGSFQETLWSSILRAKADPQALERLVVRTWKPLYFYLRRKGRDVESAKDLTQAFFAHLLEAGLLDRVERGRGRFRSFLIAALEHFLANEWRVGVAAKRGGGRAPLSLDFGEAERQYEPLLAATPEALYDRAWAVGILAEAMQALRSELGGRFEAVRAHLAAEEARPTYRETADRLGLSESDVGNLLHGARFRLGALIRERVGETVEGDPGGEVADLFRALSGNP